MNQLAITVLVAATLGVVLVFFVGRNPKLFWPLFIGLPIVFAGFMVSGYAVLDEYFAAVVLVGGIWAVGRGLVPPETEKKFSFHSWLFFFTILYFLLESLRGAIFLGDVKILRWVGFYLLFVVFAVLIKKWRFPVPSAVSAAKIGAIASSLYFGIYFLSGLFNECIRGLARWNLQGVFWAGSAYAIFPIVLAAPAGVFLLRSEDKNLRRLGWLTLITSIFAVSFYESRIGFFALLGMLIFVPLMFRLKRTLKIIGGIVLISSFAFWTTYWLIHDYWLTHEGLQIPYCSAFLRGERTPAEFFGRLFEFERYKLQGLVFIDGVKDTVLAPVVPRVSDEDRDLHLKAGFLTATQNPIRFFIGGGTHSHRLLLRPQIQELYQEKLPGVETSGVVRTTGASAMLVDFGFVGLALIIANLILVMKAIVAGERLIKLKDEVILISALLFIPIWLSVSNIQDIVTYFSLLMPTNFFLLLSSRGKEATV